MLHDLRIWLARWFVRSLGCDVYSVQAIEHARRCSLALCEDARALEDAHRATCLDLASIVGTITRRPPRRRWLAISYRVARRAMSDQPRPFPTVSVFARGLQRALSEAAHV